MASWSRRGWVSVLATVEGFQLRLGGLLGEYPDLLLRARERLLADPRELHPPLEGFQGLLQAEVSLFHGIHQGLELGEGLLEGGFRGVDIGHGGNDSIGVDNHSPYRWPSAGSIAGTSRLVRPAATVYTWPFVKAAAHP
jgi:hypothetical protein